MKKMVHELDINSLFYAMFRKVKYFIFSYIAIAVIIAGVMFYFTYIYPSYVSQSVIYISTRSNIQDSISASELSEMSQMTNTYLQIIKSNRLASKVINQLNLGVNTNAFLSNNLSAQTISSTPFIKIAASWGNVQMAHDINKAVIDNTSLLLQEMKITGELVIVDGSTDSTLQNVPGTSLLIAIFLFGGFAIGFLCVLFNELLYKGFRTEEDVENILKLGNLGVIPQKRTI